MLPSVRGLLLGQGLPKHPRYDLSRRRALAGDHSASWAPRVEVCGPEAASTASFCAIPAEMCPLLLLVSLQPLALWVAFGVLAIEPRAS